MQIKAGSNKVEIENVKKLSEVGKGFGLMFRRREKAKALLFEFKKPTKLKIHSCFVFFSFLAIWLDDKNKIIGKKIVKPFEMSISPEKPFSKLLEIPFNDKYEKVIQLLVGNWKSLKRDLPMK